MRPAVVVPVVLAVLLVVAVAFAIGEFTADKETGVDDPRTTTASATTSAVPPPLTTTPATETTSTDVVTETETAIDSPSTTSATSTTTAAAGTAAVGADCTEPGATGTTADGASVYCANLQYTDRYLWSTSPGEITNPVVTSSPAVPPPSETESPVRICMEQTGHTRLRCAADILRGNAG